jgi:hypothetical protein
MNSFLEHVAEVHRSQIPSSHPLIRVVSPEAPEAQLNRESTEKWTPFGNCTVQDIAPALAASRKSLTIFYL